MYFFFLLHSDKEVEIVEVETALYYAPKLEQIILSKLDLKNYEFILKIEGLDPVALLHRVKVITNGRHLASSKVSIEYVKICRKFYRSILIMSADKICKTAKQGRNGRGVWGFNTLLNF